MKALAVRVHQKEPLGVAAMPIVQISLPMTAELLKVAMAYGLLAADTSVETLPTEFQILSLEQDSKSKNQHLPTAGQRRK